MTQRKRHCPRLRRARPVSQHRLSDRGERAPGCRRGRDDRISRLTA